jgi:hypothetical protein
VGDLFLRDVQTNVTMRVSLSSDGMQSNGASSGPDVSGSGRFIVFESLGTNLVNDDTNGMSDVFQHDIQTGITTRVSMDSAGNQSNGASVGITISDDGGTRAFHSHGSNLVDGDTNGVHDVFRAVLSDTDVDGEWDPYDNCPSVANAGQENADGDAWGDACDECPSTSTQWFAPTGDADCDGFTSAHEGLLGTDPNDPCGFTAGGGTPSETWPPDLLPTNTITIQDVLALKPVFGGSSARHDLVTSGTITIQDVLALKPFFGKSCVP